MDDTFRCVGALGDGPVKDGGFDELRSGAYDRLNVQNSIPQIGCLTTLCEFCHGRR